MTSSGPSTPTALKQNGRHVVAVREESAWRPGVRGKRTLETLRNCQDSDPGRASAGSRPWASLLALFSGSPLQLGTAAPSLRVASRCQVPVTRPAHGTHERGIPDSDITTVITASGQSGAFLIKERASVGKQVVEETSSVRNRTRSGRSAREGAGGRTACCRYRGENPQPWTGCPQRAPEAPGRHRGSIFYEGRRTQEDAAFHSLWPQPSASQARHKMNRI